MEKRINSVKYIAVLSITTLVFVLGILLGNYLASLRVMDVEHLQTKLTTQLMGLELRDELLKHGSLCNLSWWSLGKEKVDMGYKMIALEKRLGKEDEEVLRQKETYQLLELRILLLLQQIKGECKKDINILIFFYTNKQDDSLGSAKLSEDEGFVLDTIYSENESNVNIFSFDINTENPALNMLKEIYGIKAVPSLVINENVYLGIISKKQIEDILYKR